MNTIKGMIKDLRREETHIGGCTTEGELIIALESLERSVQLPYNATNGDVIKAMFPSVVNSTMDLVEAFNRAKEWWNAPYSVSNTNVGSKGE